MTSTQLTSAYKAKYWRAVRRCLVEVRCTIDDARLTAFESRIPDLAYHSEPLDMACRLAKIDAAPPALIAFYAREIRPAFVEV